MLLPRKLLIIVYVGIGIVVAASKDYLENLDTLKPGRSRRCSRSSSDRRGCCLAARHFPDLRTSPDAK